MKSTERCSSYFSGNARCLSNQPLQVIQPGLLREGFELVRRKQLDVTDDVSIVEALGRPVKVTRGSYTNIKVTANDRHRLLHFEQVFLADICNQGWDVLLLHVVECTPLYLCMFLLNAVLWICIDSWCLSWHFG